MTPRWTPRSARAACLSVALLLAVAGCASAPTVAFGGPDADPLLAARFPHRDASAHFEIASAQRIPLQPLLDVAETTLVETRAWLGLARAPAPGPTRIYVAAGAADAALVQREHGLDDARWLAGREPFRGRCFAEARVIVVPYESVSLRWQVSHEVTHLVFHEIVGRNVEIVNEGLAEVIPWWILSGAKGTPETCDAGYELYDRRLGQAVLSREVPTFDAFLGVEEATFYDERANWLWYALSWKLAKVLVESRDPTIGGRMRAFLDALARGGPVRDALAQVYDVRAVGREWNESVLRAATWRPLFGGWRAEGATLIGSVAGTHSACAVSREVLFPGEGFGFEFSLDDAPPRDVAFGFAFDVRGEDDFAYVEFRPSYGRVVVAEREAGRWVRVETLPLELEGGGAIRPARRGCRVGLRAAGDGRLELSVDRRRVFRYELGRMLRGGRAGLMFENCDPSASESDVLEMRFDAVVLAR